VDAHAPGVERRPLETLDLTRSLGATTFFGAPARLLGSVGSANRVIEYVLDKVMLAIAAESVGGMRACLELSVEYAKTRRQFGVPIGSFQAVAHRCVDMLQHTEFAGAAVHYAAAAEDERSDEAPVAAKVAAAYFGPAYHSVTAETIQVHGGLGFTWEHDAHLYYRRCRSNEHLFGRQADRYRAVADQIGL
jgi:alkylation response protein AidB-like acyl-CoA dehydrogenase